MQEEQQHHPKGGGGRQHHPKGGGRESSTTQGGEEKARQTTQESKQHTKEGCECDTTQSSTPKMERRGKTAPPKKKTANHHFTFIHLIFRYSNVVEFDICVCSIFTTRREVGDTQLPSLLPPSPSLSRPPHDPPRPRLSVGNVGRASPCQDLPYVGACVRSKLASRFLGLCRCAVVQGHNTDVNDRRCAGGFVCVRGRCLGIGRSQSF